MHQRIKRIGGLMPYTTINKSTDHFNTKTYSGTGSAQSITGVGFRPDWLWIKHREDVSNHKLHDAIRTSTKVIGSNETSAEATVAQGVTSFDSDGFSLGTDASVNATGAKGIVAWNWKANGSGSANTDGSINTTVSANTTAGFSIITYTGTGSAGTIGHGLGVKPSAWHVKARSETRAWYGWHNSLALGDKITLNESGAKTTDTSLFGTNAPTNQVINLGSSVGVNNNGVTFVCYAFAEIPGYSKFGSYIGNGQSGDNGKFIYTGFRPAYVMTKKTSGTGDWMIRDNRRYGYNGKWGDLYANTNGAEGVNDSNTQSDLLSNGFKLRMSHTNHNENGGSYIYYAFAEAPLVGSNNVPAMAR